MFLHLGTWQFGISSLQVQKWVVHGPSVGLCISAFRPGCKGTLSEGNSFRKRPPAFAASKRYPALVGRREGASERGGRWRQHRSIFPSLPLSLVCFSLGVFSSLLPTYRPPRSSRIDPNLLRPRARFPDLSLPSGSFRFAARLCPEWLHRPRSPSDERANRQDDTRTHHRILSISLFRGGPTPNEVRHHPSCLLRVDRDVLAYLQGRKTRIKNVSLPSRSPCE